MKFICRILPFLLVSILVVLLVFTSGSWLIARKVVAMLILPAGALWLIGILAMSWPGIRVRVRWGLFLAWLVYSLAGSPYLGIALLKPLENRFLAFEEIREPLDALVLLGGGTIRSPGGAPALGTHGDRVLRPAMLYHQGQARHLITTGQSITEKGRGRLLSRETSIIWQNLDVPVSAITEVPDPRNTEEELAAVAELLRARPEWRKVGLCSSASHLSRAMGEAEKQGLALIPVPSDFRSMSLKFSPLYVIPQGRGFRDVQTALWEYLGQLL
ncbi:MAG: YdcF family protein [Verrucomicrobiales bacterium]|nr:YdcF family protein [Verrucomicrobiales bacterium]